MCSDAALRAGERIQLHLLEDGSCKYWSRNSNEHGAMSQYSIYDPVMRAQARHITLVLDGELILWNKHSCAPPAGKCCAAAGCMPQVATVPAAAKHAQTRHQQRVQIRCAACCCVLAGGHPDLSRLQPGGREQRAASTAHDQA